MGTAHATYVPKVCIAVLGFSRSQFLILNVSICVFDANPETAVLNSFSLNFIVNISTYVKQVL